MQSPRAKELSPVPWLQSLHAAGFINSIQASTYTMLFTMFVLALAYLVISFVHALPQNIPDDIFLYDEDSLWLDWDNSAIAFNADFLNANPFIASSVPTSEHLFSSAPDEAIFATDDSEEEPFDYIPTGVYDEELVFVYDPLEEDNVNEGPYDIWDSSISTAGCNSKLDSSAETWDSSSSINSFESDESPDLFVRSEGHRPDDLRKDWRYTTEPTYLLHPDTDASSKWADAVAPDGTPLKPKQCPSGKERTCCTDGTFSKCWAYSRYPDLPLCKFTLNLYCCDNNFTGIGAPASGCEAMKWIFMRSRSGQTDQGGPPNQPNPFEGVFDIFEFPELNPTPDPAYCPVPSRL